MKMYSILKNWLNLAGQGHRMGRGWMGFRMSQNPGSVTHSEVTLGKQLLLSKLPPPHQ